jgi:predicted transcriptional regulator
MREITSNFTLELSGKSGTFSTFFHKIQGKKKTKTNSDLAMIRKLLSNEKARLLIAIKEKTPASIYELAKILKRDFKAVRQDIRLLEQFGIIELTTSIKNNRERLRPIIAINNLIVTIKF